MHHHLTNMRKGIKMMVGETNITKKMVDLNMQKHLPLAK